MNILLCIIISEGAFKSGTVNMMSLDLDKEVMLPEPNSGRDQDIFPQTKPWLWIPITVVIVAVFVVALALHRLKNFKKTKGERSTFKGNCDYKNPVTYFFSVSKSSSCVLDKGLHSSNPGRFPSLASV